MLKSCSSLSDFLSLACALSHTQLFPKTHPHVYRAYRNIHTQKKASEIKIMWYFIRIFPHSHIHISTRIDTVAHKNTYAHAHTHTQSHANAHTIATEIKGNRHLIRKQIRVLPHRDPHTNTNRHTHTRTCTRAHAHVQAHARAHVPNILHHTPLPLRSRAGDISSESTSNSVSRSSIVFTSRCIDRKCAATNTHSAFSATALAVAASERAATRQVRRVGGDKEVALSRS